MSDSELGRCTRERQVLEFSSRITLALQAKDAAPHGSCSGVCMSAGVRWGQDRGKRKSFVNWKRELLRLASFQPKFIRTESSELIFLGKEMSKKKRQQRFERGLRHTVYCVLKMEA